MAREIYNGNDVEQLGDRQFELDNRVFDELRATAMQAADLETYLEVDLLETDRDASGRNIQRLLDVREQDLYEDLNLDSYGTLFSGVMTDIEEFFRYSGFDENVEAGSTGSGGSSEVIGLRRTATRGEGRGLLHRRRMTSNNLQPILNKTAETQDKLNDYEEKLSDLQRALAVVEEMSAQASAFESTIGDNLLSGMLNTTFANKFQQESQVFINNAQNGVPNVPEYRERMQQLLLTAQTFNTGATAYLGIDLSVDEAGKEIDYAALGTSRTAFEAIRLDHLIQGNVLATIFAEEPIAPAAVQAGFGVLTNNMNAARSNLATLTEYRVSMTEKMDTLRGLHPDGLTPEAEGLISFGEQVLAQANTDAGGVIRGMTSGGLLIRAITAPDTVLFTPPTLGSFDDYFNAMAQASTLDPKPTLEAYETPPVPATRRLEGLGTVNFGQGLVGLETTPGQTVQTTTGINLRGADGTVSGNVGSGDDFVVLAAGNGVEAPFTYEQNGEELVFVPVAEAGTPDQLHGYLCTKYLRDAAPAAAPASGGLV